LEKRLLGVLLAVDFGEWRSIAELVDLDLLGRDHLGEEGVERLELVGELLEIELIVLRCVGMDDSGVPESLEAVAEGEVASSGRETDEGEAIRFGSEKFLGVSAGKRTPEPLARGGLEHVLEPLGWREGLEKAEDVTKVGKRDGVLVGKEEQLFEDLVLCGLGRKNGLVFEERGKRSAKIGPGDFVEECSVGSEVLLPELSSLVAKDGAIDDDVFESFEDLLECGTFGWILDDAVGNEVVEGLGSVLWKFRLGILLWMFSSQEIAYYLSVGVDVRLACVLGVVLELRSGVNSHMIVSRNQLLDGKHSKIANLDRVGFGVEHYIRWFEVTVRNGGSVQPSNSFGSLLEPNRFLMERIICFHFVLDVSIEIFVHKQHRFGGKISSHEKSNSGMVNLGKRFDLLLEGFDKFVWEF